MGAESKCVVFVDGECVPVCKGVRQGLSGDLPLTLHLLFPWDRVFQ